MMMPMLSAEFLESISHGCPKVLENKTPAGPVSPIEYITFN